MRGSLKALVPIVVVAALLAGCQQQGSTTAVRPVGERDYSDSPAMANVHLGVAYLRKGNLERALTKLHKAVKQDPTLPPAYNALGLLYERLSDPQRAEEYYQRAVNLEPGDSSSQNNYGQFLCKQGRVEEGEKRFLQALANPLYRTPEVAYTNAGLCVAKTGEVEKAEGYLRKALDASPIYAPALLEMARVSFARQQYLQVRAFLQRYLLVASHSAQTLWLGIQAEEALGNHNAAASYRLLLKNNYPQSEEARLMGRRENHER